MKSKSYNVLKVESEKDSFTNSDFWKVIPVITIDNYLWSENSYKPRVEAKVCYNDRNLFVNLKSYEVEITAKYTEINDPVHKDSCVEFFVNLFPCKTNKYFNFEVNPIGTMHIGFGAVGSRIHLPIEDVKKVRINSTISKPIIGEYGNNFWEIYYRIPISLFEKYYELKFNSDNAIGNFYKCGDEAKYNHYGVWNNIDSEKPNFHQPNYFGDLIFV
ncbi:MAG: hypothetical protein H6552_10445 [Chitinophagales bacterium]|nr:hypothetical protein [Chitinophagales bacterium]